MKLLSRTLSIFLIQFFLVISVHAEVQENTPRLIKLPLGFKPRQLLQDGSVLGLSKQRSSTAKIAKYDGQSRKLIEIADTGLNGNDPDGALFQFNSLGESIRCSDQGDDSDSSAIYRKADGTETRFNLGNSSLTCFTIGLLDSGVGVLKVFDRDLNSYNKALYIFIKNGVEIGRWQKDYDSGYSSERLLENGKLIIRGTDFYEARSNSEMIKSVSENGMAADVSTTAFPIGASMIGTTADSQGMIVASGDYRRIFLTDFLSSPAKILDQIKTLSYSGSENKATNAGSISLSAGLTRFSDSKDINYSLNCTLPNSAGILIDEFGLRDIQDNGSVLVEFRTNDDGRQRGGILRFSNTKGKFANYCLPKVKVQLLGRCGENAIVNSNFGSQSFSAKRSVNQSCPIRVKLVDTKSKPLKGAKIELINLGVYSGGSEGSYDQQKGRVAKAVTDSKGVATISGRVFEDKDDYELILPANDRTYHSQTVKFYGPR